MKLTELSQKVSFYNIWLDKPTEADWQEAASAVDFLGAQGKAKCNFNGQCANVRVKRQIFYVIRVAIQIIKIAKINRFY